MYLFARILTGFLFLGAGILSLHAPPAWADTFDWYHLITLSPACLPRTLIALRIAT